MLLYILYMFMEVKMRNDELIVFEEIEEVAEEIREMLENEKELNKLPASEELYIRRLKNVLSEFDRVKAKNEKVTHINVDTVEYYTFKEFLNERNADEVKESKIKSGLSTEIKALIEKYEKEAKEKGKGFINFASESKILYVLKWIEKESKILPVFYPIFDLKENRKLTESDIRNNRYITDDVVRMQEIISKSNEIMEARAKGE